MKEGNVVLTPLPQADGQIKNRPARVTAAATNVELDPVSHTVVNLRRKGSNGTLLLNGRPNM